MKRTSIIASLLLSCVLIVSVAPSAQATHICFGVSAPHLTNGADTFIGHPYADAVSALGAWDTLYGTDPAQPANDVGDIFCGGYGDDYINGLAGDDKIAGQDDNDDLFGTTGNDKVEGNQANDIVEGGSGNDTLNGNPGNDTLLDGTGTDTVNGGDGYDIWCRAADGTSDTSTGIEDIRDQGEPCPEQ